MVQCVIQSLRTTKLAAAIILEALMLFAPLSRCGRLIENRKKFNKMSFSDFLEERIYTYSDA